MRHLDFTRPVKQTKNKYEKYKHNYERYENTPERKQYQKEYNKAYRTEHEVYVQCDCGSEVKGISMYAHVRTQKHIAYLQNVVVPVQWILFAFLYSALLDLVVDELTVLVVALVFAVATIHHTIRPTDKVFLID